MVWVVKPMIADMYNMVTISQFSISSDSYYGYVPCFKREDQQESPSRHDSRLETVDSTQQCCFWRLQKEQLQEQRSLEQQEMRFCGHKRKFCDYLSRDHELAIPQVKKCRKETTAMFVSPRIQDMDWDCDSNTMSTNPTNIVNCSTLEQQPSSSTGCYQVAGNSSLISKQDHNHSDGDVLNRSNIEYEKLLFTTHGCSVYHHQRAQLLDNRMITEF
ncbi:hypothetical protein DMN91_007076 [Ooceraea biroi]|uniref:Uncharacterized protein n=1 Tax=Ooceraea biroi TaxID=2015173 RepID=A0A026WLX8_OOCBI|nr:uncharacterized protein LOC105277571 [Ooceraea biroi]EZA57062.1 hypothetical protein X777_01668 [Ooceraea biroi]RLU20466.1 hypothetical protein DMN91_007076 [Ooceraea biroi]